MTTSQSRRATPRWLSPERLSVAFSVGLLALLELIPVQALLLTYAGVTQFSLADIFGPLWLIATALLAFALIRWRLGELHPAWIALVSLVVALIAAAGFVILSPTAYGAIPGGPFSPNWINQLVLDATLDTQRFNGLFFIVPMVIYLGWRGLTLGAPPPRIEPTLRRFTISLAVVMAACLGAVTAPASLQAGLTGALLGLLALDVFAGLAAAAMARRGAGREEGQVESGAEMARWLLTALAAAALVILVSFVIGLALNLNLFLFLLRALGPVGEVVNRALAWLVNGLAYLLWIAFVKTIGAWLFQHTAFYVSPPKAPSVAGPVHQHAALQPPPLGFLVAAGFIVGLIVLIILGFILYEGVRAILRSLKPAPDPELDEDRESLDARGLLRRQAQELLAGLRRGSGAERDPLTHGSARWLYREALRAGASVGIARRPGETADEYSRRLAQTMQERGAPPDEPALAALTATYDDARYGDSVAEAPPAVVASSRRLTATLSKLRR
jgi:Domain of unknown function (DUF4129)